MRKTVNWLAALTCVLGGSLLLPQPPAQGQASQSQWLPCSTVIGTYCPRNGARGYCELAGGYEEIMVCYDHGWILP